jgi:multidrug transporter EmrE-like cation transporter
MIDEKPTAFAIGLALMAPIVGTVGQILLKIGMQRAGPVGRGSLDHPLALVMRVFANPWILIAIPWYGAGFLIWLVVLSKLNLSYAYSFLALAYVLVPLFSWLLFRENIPILQWVGILVVCLGLMLIGFAK